MAPLTRSAASGSAANLHSQPVFKEPEIISIDEEEEDESMGDDDSYLDNEDEQLMDEELDDVNGHALAENGSAFPVLEPSLKSVVSFPNSARGLPGSPKLFTESGAAHEAVEPLRRTADRVTRQIEAFAEKLDQFKRKNATDEFQSVQAAYRLVESYRDLAQTALQDFNRQQTLRQAKTGFRLSSTADAKNEEEQRQLQDLQLEVNTWRLLLNLISIDDPASRASFVEGQQSAFQNLHRYSSDREIWEEFLNADQYALECVVAMRWLEETAKAQSEEIDNLIADMESKAQRGQGLWAHGWLYTKEAIKGHKRLRAWPQPLEPNDPGISRSLLTTDDQKPLITQLDPDALTRQKHGLQPQDEFYERATWMTCWKMIRQGDSWTTIREWAQGRLENWRAVSLCGSSVDKETANTRTPADDGLTRLMNSRTHDSWRAACSALAQDPNTEEFQRAVYALLCGESEPAARVCTTWDDFLYVYFNRVVLSRYQGFCRQFQRKLSHFAASSVAFKPEPAGHSDLQKFFQYLRGNERTRVSSQAAAPFRIIQAAILSKSYDSFFSYLAQAVSLESKKSTKSTVVPDMKASSVDKAYATAAAHHEALKAATHIYVIVNSISYVRADTQFLETASVNITGYIADLQEKGLFDLIPLYASLLPTKMCHAVLSKIMVEMMNDDRMKQQVRIVQKHGIDIHAVLDTQWAWLSECVSSIERSPALAGYSRVRRLPDGSRVLMPPKKDLIGITIEDEDEKLIRSLEWLRSLGGQWSKICDRGAWLYRKFFVAGKLAAARELSSRMRLAEVSHETFNVDIFEFPELDPSPMEDVPLSPSKSKRSHAHRRSLSGSNGTFTSTHTSAYQQALRMWHLESLALGFDALEQFAIVYEQISKTKRRRDSGTVRDFLEELESYLQEIEDSVGLVVDEWLPTSKDDTEERDYAHIRRTYLPELLLDYHNALYYSSHSLDKPSLLTQCMTTSIWVANNAHLTRAFTEAQRMTEFMDCLALAAKAMVLTDPKHDRTFENGQTLGLWRVSVPEDEEEALLQNQK
ncbi:hypothetical protein N7462_005431 [Penicillium macrosclerotiorum]|uniref:uncharacterized protein n=1 Tax=Penicillium macrosclerotiorum TaxID=303699 RepID=UPI0025468604|nr:uncharacterized protein N7462_005431 [Penicillium macrosclerotiorum]KAJ5682266.1 hypothetical protein N7462_005431 [Penicillium macrosclerotiorum]